MMMQEITGLRPAHLPTQGVHLSATHLLGIEIELEGVQNLASAMRHMTLWHSTDDGSLRDNGREFILAAPLSGRELETAIDQFYHAANFNSSSTWTASHRCGIHIHSDVRDLTTTQYGVLLALSVLIDKHFFLHYDSAWREGINFCRPVHSDNRTIMLAKRLITDDRFSEVAIGAAEYCKYMSLNMCRVNDLGSLEYRHFCSSLSKEQLINLCLDIQHLKEFACLPTPADALAAFRNRWPDIKLKPYQLKLLGVV